MFLIDFCKEAVQSILNGNIVETFEKINKLPKKQAVVATAYIVHLHPGDQTEIGYVLRALEQYADW
jgi:hypothetical protein